MTANDGRPIAASLADRLDHLFRSVRRPDGRFTDGSLQAFHEARGGVPMSSERHLREALGLLHDLHWYSAPDIGKANTAREDAVAVAAALREAELRGVRAGLAAAHTPGPFSAFGVECPHGLDNGTKRGTLDHPR